MNDRTNRIKHAAESKDTLRAVLEILFFPMAMLYMEFMAKLKIFGSVFDGSFVYMLVMTLAAGFLLSFAAMLLSGRWRRLYYRIVAFPFPEGRYLPCLVEMEQERVLC